LPSAYFIRKRAMKEERRGLQEVFFGGYEAFLKEIGLL